jgi:ComF family protein
LAQIKEILAWSKKNCTSALRFFLDLFFPISCIGCGGGSEFLCKECLNTIQLRPARIELDDRPRDETNSLYCVPGHLLDALFATCPYKSESLLNRAIHAYKYDFIKDLAAPLSDILEKTMRSREIAESIKGFVLTPVPLHRKRYNWRGFNQAELLAKNLAEKSGLKTENLLERIIYSRPQMELSKDERLLNVKDSFVFRGSGVPEKVLLVDDVATTLSTMNACAKALKDAGCKQVFGLVLARVY